MSNQSNQFFKEGPNQGELLHTLRVGDGSYEQCLTVRHIASHLRVTTRAIRGFLKGDYIPQVTASKLNTMFNLRNS